MPPLLVRRRHDTFPASDFQLLNRFRPPAAINLEDPCFADGRR